MAVIQGMLCRKNNYKTLPSHNVLRLLLIAFMKGTVDDVEFQEEGIEFGIVVVYENCVMNFARDAPVGSPRRQ
jgi:hypothetical protein